MRLDADWWVGHPSWRQWVAWKTWEVLDSVQQHLLRWVMK